MGQGLDEPGQGRRTQVVGLFAVIVLLAILTLLRLRKPSLENVPNVLSEVPCVAGVCVGDVGQQRALDRLALHELLFNVGSTSERVIEFGIEGGGVGALYFRQNETEKHDVLDHIQLMAAGMPLGNALQALGQPEQLFLMFGCGHGYHVHGKLFYPEQGIEVQVQFPSQLDKRAEAVVLTEDTPVLSIWYFEGGKYKQWLLAMPDDLRLRNGYFDIAADLNGEFLAAAVQRWPGLSVPVEPLDLCGR
jgi:hypothetical protein